MFSDSALAFLSAALLRVFHSVKTEPSRRAALDFKVVQPRILRVGIRQVAPVNFSRFWGRCFHFLVVFNAAGARHQSERRQFAAREWHVKALRRNFVLIFPTNVINLEDNLTDGEADAYTASISTGHRRC